MGWLVDYINTYNLWDTLYTDYCQIVYKSTIMNHLKYHYWEQLNILEANNG